MKSKKKDTDEPIESGIAHYHTDDEAYLASYRAYQGPSDGAQGVPLSTLSVRSRETLSDSSFIQERPSSYNLLSCISAFLCCCPVGLAALCYSCKAKCAKNQGEFSQARELGRQAKDIAVASIVLFVFLALVAVLVVVLLWQTVGFDK